MKNPPHLGSIVRFECIEALGVSVIEAAKVLGVTRQALNNLGLQRLVDRLRGPRQEALIRKGRARLAADRLLALAEQGPNFTTDPGSIRREELYERN